LSSNYSSSAACRFFSITFAIFLFTSSPLWDALGTFAPPPLGTAAALSADIASMFKRLLPCILRMI
jgi:hypothetical protein